HSSHASGSGADEGTGVALGVPDVPDYDSEDDISWKSSDDDQVVEQAQDDEDDRISSSDDEDSDNEVEGANVQATQEIEDTHVTLTLVNPDGQQQSSSVSSGFVSNMLNLNQDTGVDDIFRQHTEATSLIDTSVTAIMALIRQI
ncbi:hypothetical protein Tco_0280170, partial [Tanacetum coccineum]